MILHPTSLTDGLTIDIYVDADVAGAWGYEDPYEPACVRSRTVHIIEGPVAWKSRLQTDLATSTVEAEYSALSITLRVAIPLLDAVRYVVNGFAATRKVMTMFRTTVHGDNQGALG